MALKISVLVASMWFHGEPFYIDTDRNFFLTPPADCHIEEWEKTGNYIRRPCLVRVEYKVQFLKDIIPYIESFGDGYRQGYESYLREYFKTGETPYDIDFTHEDFQEKFHWLLYEIDGLYDEFTKYEIQVLTQAAIEWCEENDIPYILD